tara:strand:+ start:212 stop:961 length:750 start_codon:yes stop_codon:yes gene_type:complete
MLRKVDKEQYFTDRNDSQRLIGLLNLDDYDRIIEPSAGDGAFSDYLPDCVAIDLDPKKDHIIKHDFLEWFPDMGHQKTLTIGNPPFGRNAKIARLFTRHASVFSDTIAFVLPAQCKRETWINHFPEYFHLRHSEDFFCHVKCVFQIWDRKDTKRPKIERRSSHSDFEIHHRHLSRTDDRPKADFVIGQVTGKVLDTDKVTKGSQYFIVDKTTDKRVRKRMENFDLEDYKKKSIGAVSISQSELIQLYDK